MTAKPILLAISCVTLAGCITGGANASNEGWGVGLGTVLNSDTAKTLMDTIAPSGLFSSLSEGEIGAGLRQALEIGSTNVVSQLGTVNGFSLDPNIRIPLPESLERVDSALSAIGMNSLTSDLELRLNRAAEKATPYAKNLFLSAIQGMTIRDAQSILSGPNNAATQYLRSTMGSQLAKDIQPIITQTLSDAGAIQAYDNVANRYTQIPFVSSLLPDVKGELNSYVTEKALDGIFYYVASEEAAIRENPAKRTTELLQKVFAK